MAEPVISIVTPAYNASKYIAEALDSVFAQTFPDFEIVVTNDASPDTPALEAVLAGYTDPRLRYVKIDVNKRVSGARNACIEDARGGLAFLDADDKWKPQYLETSRRRHARRPRVVGAVFGHHFVRPHALRRTDTYEPAAIDQAGNTGSVNDRTGHAYYVQRHGPPGGLAGGRSIRREIVLRRGFRFVVPVGCEGQTVRFY